MSRYSIFDIKNFDIFYEIGYREAQRHEKEIDRFLGEL
jgi:hypothetical protein